MLQNAYFLAKIGADTAENEQHFAEILPIGRRVADRTALTERRRTDPQRWPSGSGALHCLAGHAARCPIYIHAANSARSAKISLGPFPSFRSPSSLTHTFLSSAVPRATTVPEPDATALRGL